MATAPISRLDPSEPVTVADLLKRLGNLPARRVRLVPTPGTATEADLLRNNESLFRTALCELVERTLVEKPMGYEESEVAGILIMYLNIYVRSNKLGIVLAPDGMYRLRTDLVRLPDISFFSLARFPGGERTTMPILDLAPDLAVEILSKSNTRAEMARKLDEYFTAGTRLVWLVDHRARTVKVHTSPKALTVLEIDDVLDGSDVLPGFHLAIRDLFARD